MPVDKDKDSRGLMIGFHIVPNDYISKGINSTNNRGFSYSYEFSAQFNLHSSLALETGIILDNFNLDGEINNIFVGIPALVKYYLPHKTSSNPLYIGMGCHIDYSTNIGIPFNNPYKYIQPIALLELGYEVPIADKYCFNIALGYEHEIKPIYLSNNAYNTATFYNCLMLSLAQ